MNRKGDMPTILLFVIALVLAVGALFSFVSFDGSLARDSEGRNKVIGQVSFLEDYVVRESEIIGREVIDSVNRGKYLKSEMKKMFQNEIDRKVIISNLGSYFGKVKREEFKFQGEDDKYVFSMDDLILDVREGGNRIRRKVSFRIEFDSEGKVEGREISRGEAKSLS